MTVTGGDLQLYIYICEHVCTLAKRRKESQIKLFFPLWVIFILFLFQRELLCLGRSQGGVFFSFYAFFFLSPCLLVLRVIIHRGLFNCQMQQKVIRPLLFPAPTLAFSSKQKQPLLGMVIISQGFFFIPQVRNALLLHIQVTSYKHRETQDVAADALPWMMLPINTCYRCSESFLFFQAGFLTYYKNCLSIYLQCITHH